MASAVGATKCFTAAGSGSGAGTDPLSRTFGALRVAPVAGTGSSVTAWAVTAWAVTAWAVGASMSKTSGSGASRARRPRFVRRPASTGASSAEATPSRSSTSWRPATGAARPPPERSSRSASAGASSMRRVSHSSRSRSGTARIGVFVITRTPNRLSRSSRGAAR